MPRRSVLVCAGDTSGDIMAAAVLGASVPLLGPLGMWGYGGERLERAGVRLVARLESFATSGLTEAIARLPANVALVARVAEMARFSPPAFAVLVDYPDVHMVLGPALRRARVPVLWLLPPQVWAWRRSRVRAMRSFVGAVAASLPFEPAIYREAGIRAGFVGHPLGLLDAYRAVPAEPEPGTVVALLPGSRAHEVARVLPAMLGACARLRRSHGRISVRLAASPSVPGSLIESVLGSAGLDDVKVVRAGDVPAGSTIASVTLAGASVSIVHAGTATLEAALLAVPSVVVARLGRASWAVARRMVRLDHVALPSIVLGRSVFTERLQDEVTPSRLARDLSALLSSSWARPFALAASRALRDCLFVPDTPARFAALVQGLALPR